MCNCPFFVCLFVNQLKRNYDITNLEPFPPKKVLMSAQALEERRLGLELYLHSGMHIHIHVHVCDESELVVYVHFQFGLIQWMYVPTYICAYVVYVHVHVCTYYM